MVKRKAPKGGYNFKAKDDYRKQVWNAFAKELNPETSIVAFLPSKEGAEIPIALERGFKEENLIAIDENKALIAQATWRKKYPKIKFYGNDIARASERIKKDNIKINAANLDLCGNISSKMFKQVEVFIRNIIDLQNNPLIAVTMFKGREPHAVNFLSEIIIRDIGSLYGVSKRLGVLIYEISKRLGKKTIQVVTQIDNGEYRSTGKTHMVWGIFRFIGSNNIVAICDDKYEEIKYLIKEIRDTQKYADDCKYCVPMRVSRDSFRTYGHRGLGTIINEKHAESIYMSLLEAYTLYLEKIGILYNKFLTKEKIELGNIIYGDIDKHNNFPAKYYGDIDALKKWYPGRRGPLYNGQGYRVDDTKYWQI